MLAKKGKGVQVLTAFIVLVSGASTRVVLRCQGMVSRGSSVNTPLEVLPQLREGTPVVCCSVGSPFSGENSGECATVERGPTARVTYIVRFPGNAWWSLRRPRSEEVPGDGLALPLRHW